MKDIFPIAPASRGAFTLLYALGVLLLLGAGLITVLAAAQRQPALYPAGVIMILVSALIFYIAASSRHTFIELTAGTLHVRRDLFGRSLPASLLLLDQASVVNLRETKSLQPKWRMVGTAVPGYQSGWFKLRDGRSALLFVTDQQRVVCVPWRDGRVLLASVSEPEEFLAQLRKLA